MSELVLERQGVADVVGLKPHFDPRDATGLKPHLNRKKVPKKVIVFVLAFLAALATAWYGYHWWTVARWLETTDDAYVGGNVTPISPHVAGFVAQILVEDNQYVQAGQILIRLDDRDLQAALDRAQAVVRQRESTLDNLYAKRLLQQSAIRQAEADLAGATAEAAFTSEDVRRYRDAASQKAGSRQAAQRAIAVNQKSQAALRSSRARLDAAKQQLAVLDTEIAGAEAAVAEAEADLQAARLRLGYTEVRSPINGWVGNRAAQVGAYVGEGTYLVTIIPAQGLWIDANFKEDQLERMKPGQSATVVADLMSSRVFDGHVVSLSPATGAIFSVIPPENATGNFTKIVQRLPVRIALDAGDSASDRIRPGLSTTVTIDTQPH
jgi:membrane fusion protein (multidrug efflux system)